MSQPSFLYLAPLVSGEKDNKESNKLILSAISFYVRFGAYFFLKEEWRVEGPTLYGNTMQVGRRPTQLGAYDMRHDVCVEDELLEYPTS